MKGVSDSLQKELLKEMNVDLMKFKAAKNGKIDKKVVSQTEKGEADPDPKPAKVKNPNPTLRKRNEHKAKEDIGLPEYEVRFSDENDPYIYESYELGYIAGNNAYFNEDHPLIKRAVKATSAIKNINIPAGEAKDMFIKIITNEYRFAELFDLDEKQSGAVLLSTGITLLSTGAYRKAAIRRVKKEK